MKKVEYYSVGHKQVKEELCMHLISFNPTQSVEPSECYNGSQSNSLTIDDAAKLVARTHVENFKSIFRNFFSTDNQSWAVCAIGDGCRTNQAIARAMNLPFMRCSSHKLNL